MLNTLLDDNAYRAWLLELADELDLMYDDCTPLSEAAEGYDIPTRRLERFVNREYYGGIAQAVSDSI
ncbi:MAG: hypothetical protein KGL39_18995 [Patescibacteria group bacterium]|nr:hypothetical protein [Patescibacteria group bacterium]